MGKGELARLSFKKIIVFQHCFQNPSPARSSYSVYITNWLHGLKTRIIEWGALQSMWKSSQLLKKYVALCGELVWENQETHESVNWSP